LRSLVRRIELAAEKRGASAQAIADAAVIHLLTGRVTGVVDRLRRASEMAPADAMLLNDLGAAQLASYEVSARPQDLLDALESVERSLALSAEPAPEVLFNRGLAAERLSLTTDAEESWTRFLSLDPDSSWAVEARLHLARLKAPTEEDLWPAARRQIERSAGAGGVELIAQLVARHPQRARLWSEEELLPAWGTAWLEGRAGGAAERLAVARAVGVALAGRGDRSVADFVAAIDLAAHRPGMLEALAQGHRVYARGLELYRNARDVEARTQFSAAERWLREGDSPYADWARFRAILAAFYSGENLGVVRDLDELLRQVENRSYPALRGRALLLQGMAYHRLAAMADSLRCYRLALAAFSPTGEVEHVAAAHMMIAENLAYQGDVDAAWEHRSRALSAAYDVGSSIYYYNTVREGAEDLLHRGHPLVALDLQDEMLAWDRRGNNPLTTVETLLARSRTLLGLGDRIRATADLEQAASTLSSIPPGERKFRLATDLDLVKGEMRLAADSSERSLDVAVAWATQRRDLFRLPGLLAKRAQARLAAGDRAGAIADLGAGIAEGERQEAGIADEPLRASHRDELVPLYEEMIRLQMARGRTDSAFGFADRMRTSPFATLPADSSAGATLRTLSSAMPVGTTLLEYTVLSDRTVVWLVRRGQVGVRELGIARAALERMVADLHDCIAGGGGESRLAGASTRLSRALLQPLRDDLREGDHLVVVPDETLFRVPFALLDGQWRDRYMIEGNVVSYVPSAASYLDLVTRNRNSAKGPATRLLAVANPQLDAAAFPHLPSLSSALPEAESVASIYPHAQVLTGRKATRTAFLRRAQRSDVIHIAAHAISNLEYPQLSNIPLAASAGDRQALYAHEIAHLDLRHTRLVVLAACSTAVGKISPSSGAASLARSFLAAGAPAVLATLWDIDDQAAQRLLVGFHQRLRAGAAPAAALRDAQLDMIRSGKPRLTNPRTWGAFQLIGGP
jgi:CHAT domain-containing protein/tetratricopeptide (TPR) repeat protein